MRRLRNQHNKTSQPTLPSASSMSARRNKHWLGLSRSLCGMFCTSMGSSRVGSAGTSWMACGGYDRQQQRKQQQNKQQAGSERGSQKQHQHEREQLGQAAADVFVWQFWCDCYHGISTQHASRAKWLAATFSPAGSAPAS